MEGPNVMPDWLGPGKLYAVGLPRFLDIGDRMVYVTNEPLQVAADGTISSGGTMKVTFVGWTIHYVHYPDHRGMYIFPTVLRPGASEPEEVVNIRQLYRYRNKDRVLDPRDIDWRRVEEINYMELRRKMIKIILQKIEEEKRERTSLVGKLGYQKNIPSSAVQLINEGIVGKKPTLPDTPEGRRQRVENLKSLQQSIADKRESDQSAEAVAAMKAGRKTRARKTKRRKTLRRKH